MAEEATPVIQEAMVYTSEAMVTMNRMMLITIRALELRTAAWGHDRIPAVWPRGPPWSCWAVSGVGTIVGLSWLVVSLRETAGDCDWLVVAPLVFVGLREGARSASSCITAAVDDVVSTGELGRGGVGVLDTRTDVQAGSGEFEAGAGTRSKLAPLARRTRPEHQQSRSMQPDYSGSCPEKLQ